MTKKRLPLSFDAARGWYADVPAGVMVAGSYAPISANLIHENGVYPGADPVAVLALGPSVEVELSDVPLQKNGALDAVALRAKYSRTRFADAAYTPPVEVVLALVESPA